MPGPRWRFSTVELHVTADPVPTLGMGHRNIVIEPPGYDGASLIIPDGRMPERVAVTVQAGTYAEYESLAALLRSGMPGNLEIPHAGDAWIYANARVNGLVTWEYVLAGEVWRARVEFLCPDPRPVWKTTGEQVF